MTLKLLKEMERKYEEEMKRKKHCKKISYFIRSPENKYIRKLNCLELPLKNLKFILGPCSFYSFKFGGRNFFFFGEHHAKIDRSEYELIQLGANSTNTLLFPSFVHSLVNQNKGDTYDLFFEQDYVPKEEFLTKSDEIIYKRTLSSMIDSITDQFQNCLYNKEKCEYDNLRIHYADFRKFYPQYVVKSLLKDNLNDNYWIEEEILQILDFDNPPKSKKQSRVRKQILAIKNKYIRQKVIEYFKKEIWYKKEIYDQISPSFHAVALMDLYALSRILRDFDEKMHPLAPKAFSGTAKNVLYYAGNAHIKIIVYFFEKYLKIKPELKLSGCFADTSFIPLNFEKYHYLFN